MAALSAADSCRSSDGGAAATGGAGSAGGGDADLADLVGATAGESDAEAVETPPFRRGGDVDEDGEAAREEAREEAPPLLAGTGPIAVTPADEPRVELARAAAAIAARVALGLAAGGLGLAASGLGDATLAFERMAFASADSCRSSEGFGAACSCSCSFGTPSAADGALRAKMP